MLGLGFTVAQALTMHSKRTKMWLQCTSNPVPTAERIQTAAAVDFKLQMLSTGTCANSWTKEQASADSHVAVAPVSLNTSKNQSGIRNTKVCFRVCSVLFCCTLQDLPVVTAFVLCICLSHVLLFHK
jgi:hypothetical protein